MYKRLSFSHKHAFLTLFSNLFYLLITVQWGGWHKSARRWLPLRSDEVR